MRLVLVLRVISPSRSRRGRGAGPGDPVRQRPGAGGGPRTSWGYGPLFALECILLNLQALHEMTESNERR